MPRIPQPISPPVVPSSAPRGLAPTLRTVEAPPPSEGFERVSVPRSGTLPLGAGVLLQGLDLAKLKTGHLTLEMPLQAGSYQVPTFFEKADVRVTEGTVAKIEVQISRKDGEPRVESATMRFEPKLTIKNPAASLDPSKGFMGGFVNAVSDALADVYVYGLAIADDGQVKIDGKVAKPFFMSDEPLEKRVKPGTFPTFRMTIGEVVDHGAVAVPAKSPAPLSDLLVAFGPMTKTGTYALDLKTDRTRLGLEGPGLHMTSKAKPIELHLTGETSITTDGKIVLSVKNAEGPELVTGAGSGDLIGTLTLASTPEGSLTGEGDFDFDLKVDGITGRIAPTNNVAVPLTIGGPNNTIAGKSHVVVKDSRLEAITGHATAKIDSKLNGRAKLRFAEAGIDLDNAHLKAKAEGDFAYDPKKKVLAVEGGTVDVTLKGDDAELTYGGLRVRVRGGAEIFNRTEQLAIDSTRATPEGVGTLTYRIKPGGIASGTLPPISRTMNYRLRPDGTVALKPNPNGSTELGIPQLRLTGNLDKLVDPKAPAVGTLGSAALRDHLETVTGAKWTTGNQVKLLVDGKASYPERLKIIDDAKESLYLQTLIFKDDQTGLETAKRLIAAKQRGVDVKVIVDALGNVETLEDITEGKKVYKLLRDAGIDLRLHSDPAETGLKELIDEIKKNPEMFPIKSLEDIKNPTKALGAFNALIKIAKGKVETDSGTRERITSALDHMAEAAKTGGLASVDLGALAALNPDDTLDVAEILVALKQVVDLNNRWHEKYLIADGKVAVVGGMNIADEYMLGGTGATTESFGIARPAWRDTDLLVRGPGAADAHRHFAKNWKLAGGGELPPPPPKESLAIAAEDGGGVEVLMVQSHPSTDGDHHITNAMMELIKACQPGERCYLANAYFLPTGALAGFKQCLIDAALRGVDVRIVTNSGGTSDLPQINQAAIFPYRELLAGGVRIFERTGKRTMHSKAASFGGQISTVKSWNADNRSASLNSECAPFVRSAKLAKQTELMILADMHPSVARELKLSEIETLPLAEELRNSVVATASDLM